MKPRTLLFGLLALVPVAACSGSSGGSGFGDDDAGSGGGVMDVNYFCRLAPTILAGGRQVHGSSLV